MQFEPHACNSHHSRHPSDVGRARATAPLIWTSQDASYWREREAPRSKSAWLPSTDGEEKCEGSVNAALCRARCAVTSQELPLLRKGVLLRDTYVPHRRLPLDLCYAGAPP